MSVHFLSVVVVPFSRPIYIACEGALPVETCVVSTTITVAIFFGGQLAYVRSFCKLSERHILSPLLERASETARNGGKRI